MADEGNSTVGLLNGIAKREYYGSTDITNEFLKEELFPNLSLEEFTAVYTKCSHLLKNIASAGMDFNQLEAFLTSQTKKKGGLSEPQAAAFSKFWKNKKTKIHNVMVSRSTYGKTLKNLSWRIDIKAQAKKVDQINTPTAIVELQLANKNQSQSKEDDVVQFELDEVMLGSLTRSLEEIEERLITFAK
ncbi:putative COMM domain-containing protein 1-like [Apostichopus japonicus]|uniref:COMM domain-containing protein 1 n=1 Tax=Stichopus japonicus TaxID=307972 RepID=A0A2G8LJ21_STIJA|nr:putative COMM domain-containing protein 1-like [Apostichopus japonicus]